MNGITHVGNPILEDLRLYEYHALVCVKQSGEHDGSLGQLQVTNSPRALVKLGDKTVWFLISELLLVEFNADLVEQRRQMYRQLNQELRAREKERAKAIARNQYSKNKRKQEKYGEIH